MTDETAPEQFINDRRAKAESEDAGPEVVVVGPPLPPPGPERDAMLDKLRAALERPKPLNIYQRINEVRKKVHYAQKDKTVSGQNYKAVTHDAVTALLRNELIAQGIVIVPRLRESSVTEISRTEKGTQVIRYAAKYDIDFVNVDDPADRVTVPGEAHANDSGDKAPGKATSYATKYAMLKLFSIETGESDESRYEPYEVAMVTTEQAAELVALAAEVGADADKFLRYIKAETFADIPAKAFETCRKLIEAKRPKPKPKPEAKP